MEQEDRSILAALRQEPEQAAFLVKFSLIAAAVILAWDIGAAMVLPMAIAKAVTALLIVAYGAVIVFVVARIMVTARSGNYSSGRLTVASAKRRLDRSPRVEADHYSPVSEDEAEEPELDAPEAEAARTLVPPVFNQQYFMMRLREQVKDARRDGRQMCVAAIEVNLPGADASDGDLDRIAYEMARIGSQHWQIIGQPLAVSENEFVFSLPASDPNEAHQFVREVVKALGEYWCHFGVAMFPKNATDAEGLVDHARDACEISRQGGRQPKARFPISA